MYFTIDEKNIDEVIIRTSRGKYDHIPQDELTPEQLVDILKGDHLVFTSISNHDHPEFAKLRNTLEEQGYIKTQRYSHNGDYVLKEFYLNDIKFKKGDRFLSAIAMRVAMDVAKKMGRKYTPSP